MKVADWHSGFSLKGPIGRGHAAFGCNHFENKKLNAIVIGDMKFQSSR